jgi:hypothetical protein
MINSRSGPLRLGHSPNPSGGERYINGCGSGVDGVNVADNIIYVVGINVDVNDTEGP